MNEENVIQVIDDVDSKFCIVEHYIIEDVRLDVYDLAAYQGLKYYAGRRSTCWPSGETLAKIAHCSRSRVFTSLEKLENLGYLRREPKKGGVTIYRLCRPASTVEKKQSPYCGLCENKTVHNMDGGVHVADGGVHVVDTELDSLTRYNELDKNQKQGEAKKSASPASEQPEQESLPIQDSESGAAEAAAQMVMAEFPKATSARICAAAQRWIAEYGADYVLFHLRRALGWQADNPRRRKKDAVKFLGNWLRSERARHPAADQQVDAWFDEFWQSWPGLPDGKEGAREEWRRRFAMLSGDEARFRALDAIERQLNELIDRVDRGTDPQFIPRARKFIREASLEG